MAISSTINVLYVDDEANNLQSFTATFRRNFNVFTALSAKEAKVVLTKQDIHVLVTDQRMPETTGTELLAEAVKQNPEQTRILLTAYTDVESIIDAINRGQIFRYLKKPWNEEELKTAIEEGYEVFDLRRKEKALIKQLVDKIAKR